MKRSPDPRVLSAIEDTLRARARGLENAVTGAMLLRELEYRGMGQVHLRRVGEAVSHLVERGIAIGSTSSGGYFVCETATDRKAALAEIAKKCAALGKRLRVFSKHQGDALAQLALKLAG